MPGEPAGLLSTGDSARSFSARSSLVPHAPAVAVAVPPTGGRPPSASRFCRLYQSTYHRAPPAIASAASGIPTPRPILRDLLVPPVEEDPSLPSLPFWMAVGVGDDGTGLVKRLVAVSEDDSVTNDGVVVGVVVRTDPVPFAPPPDVVLAGVVAVVSRVGEAYVGEPVKDVSDTPSIVCARPGLTVNAPPPGEQLHVPSSNSWAQQNRLPPQDAMAPSASASSRQ